MNEQTWDLAEVTVQIANWLWRASWQGSVLVLIVLAVQRLFRSRLTPAGRMALWWLVLARLALPALPPSPWSLYNVLETPRLEVARTGSPQPAEAAVNGGQSSLPLAVDPREAIVPPSPPPEPSFSPEVLKTAVEPELARFPAPVILPTSTTSPIPPRPTVSPAPWRTSELLFWAWLLGASVCGGRLFLGHWVLARRLRASQREAPAVLLEVLEGCRGEMGLARAPKLRLTTAVDGPALFGFWRCQLLAPPDLETRFSREEWRHVFLHELAHVRRWDARVHWLAVAVQAIHWFNPLVWLACHRLRADRELACDAAVLERAGERIAHAYGRTILKLLNHLNRPTLAPSLVRILEDKRQIEQRIRRIADFRPSRCWPTLTGVLLAGLGMATLTDARLASAPEAPDRPPARTGSTVDAPNPEQPNAEATIRDLRAAIAAGNLEETKAGLDRACLLFPDHPAVAPFVALLKAATARVEAHRLASRPSEAESSRESKWYYSSKTLDEYPIGAEMRSSTYRGDFKPLRAALETLRGAPAPVIGAEPGPTARLEAQDTGLTLEDLMREFFRRATGVEFGGIRLVPSPTMPPARPDDIAAPVNPLFIGDRASVLFCRAPLREQERVARAVEALNAAAGRTNAAEAAPASARGNSNAAEPKPEVLEGRVFRVDPVALLRVVSSEKPTSAPAASTNTVVAGLAPQTTVSSGTREEAPDTGRFQERAREFFHQATGILFSGQTPEGMNEAVVSVAMAGNRQIPFRPMFLNSRTGMLFVRATKAELDHIAEVIEAFNLERVEERPAPTPTPGAAAPSGQTPGPEGSAAAGGGGKNGQPSATPAEVDRTRAAEALVQQGKRAYEAGRLAEAKTAFSGGTNRIRDGRGRHRIERLLDEIVLPAFPTHPKDESRELGVVLQELVEAVRSLDPEKEGVPLLIASHLGQPSLVFQNPEPGGDEPGSGRSLFWDAGTPAAPPVVASLARYARVRISPQLRQARLRDVLDAIAKCAEAPDVPGFPGIEYDIEDYDVVFSPRLPRFPQLHSKTFRLQVEPVLLDLDRAYGPVAASPPAGSGGSTPETRSVPGGIGGGDLGGIEGGGFGGGEGAGVPRGGAPSTANSTIQDRLRRFLGEATGIRFEGEPGGGKSTGLGGGGFPMAPPFIRPLFFNDRTGILFVRATLNEMNTLEDVIQSRHWSVPPITHSQSGEVPSTTNSPAEHK